jgi:hypothetical protein
MTIPSLMVFCAEAGPTKVGATLKAKRVETAHLFNIAVLHAWLNVGLGRLRIILI